MSVVRTLQNLDEAQVGESTSFDSLARLVPEELQTAYYRVLAHTRTLSPDDEMLRILEAMGVLALLTCHTPKTSPMNASAFSNCWIVIFNFQVKRNRRRWDTSTSSKIDWRVYLVRSKLASILSRLPSSWEKVCGSTSFSLG